MTVRSIPRNALLAALVALPLSAGCAGPAEIADGPRPSAQADDTTTVAVAPPEAEGGPEILPRVAERPTPLSPYDLEHSDVALRVSFDSALVRGHVRHRLRVRRDGVDGLPFHAEGLDVEAVVRVDGERPDTLRTRREGSMLYVVPSSALERDETVHLDIHYSARAAGPEAGEGLVFVDPSGTDPFLPTQAWTLGQPSANRRWLPTWDHPDDAATLALSLTVPDSMQTIATGDLVETTEHDGWRTDRWRLDVPQPTYLTAFAVGQWRVETDTYVREDLSQVPLEYWLDPALAGDAVTTFGDTPFMMAVLERMTGMPFVWPEYKQVVLRAFSAGGMEHSTATFLMEEAQLDERERLDGDVADLLAHELAHHWFGNVVTAESWAQLALNEGFATYSERLYLEAAESPDEAAAKGLEQRLAYLDEARDVRRPIVWYGYDHPNDLFDAHAYEKAALVLHTLREEVGERVWWQAVQRYLAAHRHQGVHLDDLRRAFEQASSRDLSWFFEQWFLEPGHPELEIDHTLDRALGIYQVRVRQVQDTTSQPLYRFSADLRLSMRGMMPYSERVEISTADTTFRIAASGTIDYGAFDPEHDVLSERTVVKPVAEWRAQAADASMQARLDAVEALAAVDPERAADGTIDALRERASSDAAPVVRVAAVAALRPYLDRQPVRDALFRIADGDASAHVRAATLEALVASGDPLLRPTLVDAVSDPSMLVARVAAGALAERYPGEAERAFPRLRAAAERGAGLALVLIDWYSGHASAEAEAFLAQRAASAPEAWVRLAALEGLIGHEAADASAVRRVLVARLSDPSRDIRRLVVEALAGDDDAAARAALEARLESEPDEALRARILSAVEAHDNSDRRR